MRTDSDQTRARISIATPKFIDACHELDIAVHVWTIDDEVEMIQLLDHNVDGIMTDLPQLLLDVLARPRRLAKGKRLNVIASSPELAIELRKIVGHDHVLSENDLTAGYSVDWTGRFVGSTPIVVRPSNTEETASVVELLNRNSIPLIPQGGNTGLVGGSVPMSGEVLLSLKRLNALEPVDGLALQVTVGAGATLAETQAHVREHDFEIGVDLAARDSCTIGGMIATNAGGINVLRYGAMREQLIGVEAVMSDGTVIKHLEGLEKDNTGYHLPSLLAGSEGTLAVITKARLRLRPQLPDKSYRLDRF